MSYEDILQPASGAAMVQYDSPNQPNGQLAVRVNESNPNHHLWNNRGTWWCHYTLHKEDYTAERVRVSLKTADLDLARERRDELLMKVGN